MKIVRSERKSYIIVSHRVISLIKLPCNYYVMRLSGHTVEDIQGSVLLKLQSV